MKVWKTLWHIMDPPVKIVIISILHLTKNSTNLIHCSISCWYYLKCKATLQQFCALGGPFYSANKTLPMCNIHLQSFAILNLKYGHYVLPYKRKSLMYDGNVNLKSIFFSLKHVKTRTFIFICFLCRRLHCWNPSHCLLGCRHQAGLL